MGACVRVKEKSSSFSKHRISFHSSKTIFGKLSWVSSRSHTNGLQIIMAPVERTILYVGKRKERKTFNIFRFSSQATFYS